jgi:hypothetical protein
MKDPRFRKEDRNHKKEEKKTNERFEIRLRRLSRLFISPLKTKRIIKRS